MTKKKTSRQAQWQRANRKAGLCGCGRPFHSPYRQCLGCLLYQRRYYGYKGKNTLGGKGRPPGTKRRRVKKVRGRAA